MLGGFCYLLYFCKKINDMEETKQIKISDYNYPLPDERIAKFPLPVRDQSKLLVYQHGQISETHFNSLPDYLEPGTLMIFNNTKVIQARLHFRKETGALIEIFCLEPIEPNDYVLNFQQTQHAAWLCMIGNLKKWKEGPLHKEMTVKGKTLTLTATRGECHGTSHWIDFTWDNPEVTFADILEFFGELPIPPYLNRETQESDKETYQTVYSKIKGSVAAPTAGLHFTERVLNALKEKGVDLEEVTLHVGAGTFKPVKSEEIEGHEMHTEYISVNRGTIEKLLAHGGTNVTTFHGIWKLFSSLQKEVHEKIIMLGGFCYLLYFCKKINDMEETKHIKISDYNYPLPDERIAKFPLPVRDQSKLLVYQHGQISETHFTSLPDYLEPGTLMIFNNTKVIQARLHFRKETGALIEIFCLEPIKPNDYVLNFQQTQHAAWLCMIGNLKKWKEGPLHKEMTVKGKKLTLTATRGECHGTSHWIDFTWDNPEVTFADILEFFGELPIPPYLNRETQESDKETYQTVYSKIKGSVAAPTAGLHFTERVLNALKEKGVDLEEVTLHVGAGTFKPVKSEEIEGHEMHTEYISVNRGTIEKLLAHGSEAVAVGTTSVRTLESLYYIGVTLSQHPDASQQELHVQQWQPYETHPELSTTEALQQILDYMDRNQLDALHTSTQIIIAPGYNYHIVKKMVTNFHQPQSTLLLLVSAFVKGNWRPIYNYALAHDFRFLSYGDSSLLIP